MTKYDWKRVRPELAQRLMAALDAYYRGELGGSIELKSCLQMARAEAAPKLRTRAEVEHEIADLLLYNTRSWGGLEQHGGVFIRFLKGSGNDRKLSELCVELADIRKTEESAEPIAETCECCGTTRKLVNGVYGCACRSRLHRHPSSTYAPAAPVEPAQQLKEQFAGVLRNAVPVSDQKAQLDAEELAFKR